MKKYINEVTGAAAWLRDGAKIPYGFKEDKPARKSKKTAVKKPEKEETEE